MKVNGVIFDMDGTLIESLTFWKYFFKRVGVTYLNDEHFTPTETVNKNMRTMSFAPAMEYFCKVCNIPTTAKEFVQFAKNELSSYYLNVATVKEGAFELLDYLKNKKIKMCLASATGLDEIMVVMKHHKLSSYFDLIMSCQEVGAGKEKPDVYYLAAKRLGENVANLVVVEDSFVALETANTAGFKTIGVFDENNFCQDRLKAASNVIYIEKGENLTKIIKEIE